jgi:hypothetical protein
MYFVFLTIKFLLDSVLEKIKSLIGIIKQLDKRVTAMSEDIVKIDVLMTETLDMPIEKEKVARFNNPQEKRID